jgi:sporulation protein YlmC with PRC-barrel domain
MSTQRTNRDLLGPEGYSEATSIPPFENLEGMEVRDIDGDKIGTVDDMYTDTGGRYARYLAVKTGWFGTKRHAIPVDDVRVEMSDGDEYLVVPYDKDTLKEGPSFERDEDLTHEHEERVYGHYGRTGYWDAVRARQTTPAPTPEIAEAEAADAIRRGDDPRGVAVKRWGV